MSRYSPCVGICSATALGDEVCKGCGRTEAEVIGWNAMTDTERKAVWERLGMEPFEAARRWVSELEEKVGEK